MTEGFESFASLARRAPAMVVGTLVGDETTVATLGESNVASSRSLFEIGSITKTFTALLLAQMSEMGEVALTDPIAKFFPEARSKPVTLVNLATHTARLPRLPRDLLFEALRNPSNPYAQYGEERLINSLSGVRQRGGVGQKFKYSNFGFALLGRALERAAGVRYEELIVDRICRPLGLTDTVAAASPEMDARLIPGHKKVGKPVRAWDLASFGPAGVLKSTADDMVSYLRAHLDPDSTPLGVPLRKVQEVRVRRGRMGIGLGWLVSERDGQPLLWHNGGTGGFSSFAGFDPQGRRGIVVLANARVAGPMTKLGIRWLERAAG